MTCSVKCKKLLPQKQHTTYQIRQCINLTIGGMYLASNPILPSSTALLRGTLRHTINSY